MKKIVLIVTTILISIFSVQGQTLETIGSGVADFLLSNPSTVNKMNPTQQAALSVIGNLLKTVANRKHDINVAKAGRTQMNFYTSSGQQIQLVMDKDENVFALRNGVIYPISKNVVNEARDYVLSQQPGYMNYIKNNNTSTNSQLMLPNFNINHLGRLWSEPYKSEYVRIASSKELYLSSLINDYKIPVSNIYVIVKKDLVPLQNFNRYMAKHPFLRENVFLSAKQLLGKQPLTVKSGFLVFDKIYFLCTQVIKIQFRGVFAAKWVNDLNNDNSWEFDEFHDIRRNFYQNEPFLIATGLYTSFPYYIKLTIMNQITGKVVYSQQLDDNGEKFDQGIFRFNGDVFKPGIYVYNIAFIRSSNDEEIENHSDKFQILALNPPKENEKKQVVKNKSQVTSKEKMINELIQLLKEGKISQETFKESLKAIEKK